jgi:hypothetical protein
MFKEINYCPFEEILSRNVELRCLEQQVKRGLHVKHDFSSLFSFIPTHCSLACLKYFVFFKSIAKSFQAKLYWMFGVLCLVFLLIGMMVHIYDLFQSGK